MKKSGLIPGTSLVILILSALACNFPVSSRADTAATSQAVFLTITAQAGGAEGIPTATPEPDDTLSATPASSPAMTATPPAYRTGNGGALLIPRCGGDVTVDGDNADWESFGSSQTTFSLLTNTFRPENWAGLDDSSAVVNTCWDDEYLHLFIEVTDDALVQTQRGLTQWRGDEIEILFDADLQRDYYETTWDQDDYQLGLSPGNFSEVDPGSVIFHPVEDPSPAIELSSIRPIGTGGSYLLESSIPWSIFSVTPAVGENYGFCVAISDNDLPGQAAQQSMVSHCLHLVVRDPTTWITVTLDE